MTVRSSTAPPGAWVDPEARNADNRRRVLGALAVPWVATAVVVFVLGVVVGHPVIGLIVALVAATLTAWAVYRTADSTVLRIAGALPAGRDDHARLFNLIEGLCVTAGLPEPAVAVVDTDEPNALVTARGPRAATVVVTTGATRQLTRVELEAVLAQQLSHIATGDATANTVAFAVTRWVRPDGFRSWLSARTTAPQTEELADLAAVSLTRYPPGLIAALERIDAHPTGPDRGAPELATLWIRGDRDRPDTGRAPLSWRIERLREL